MIHWNHFKVVIAPNDAYATDGEQVIAIKKIERHPQYDYSSGAYFDIAVVTLKEDIKFSFKVKLTHFRATWAPTLLGLQGPQQTPALHARYFFFH